MEKSLILVSVLVLVWTPLGQSGLGFQGCQAPDFCELSPSDGSDGFSCLAYIPQFFFNATSQDCEEFIYGGCGGNNNRFSSKKKCMETCSPCSNVAREIAPHTLGAQPYVLRQTLHDMNDACNQPQEPGPCVAYLPRYFYNATSMKCELFTYGGCKGNRNRFESLAKCQLLCHAVPEFNATEVCNLTPETGPCKAAFHRLYYNPESQRCEPFIYGGCGGNDNRFKSIKECMRLCHPEGSDVITPLVRPEERRSGPVCTLPPKTGLCRANLPRYFYNSTSHECELFTYGGCGGNSNKFVSVRECKLVCHQKTQEPTETPGTDSTGPCLLPPKTGPCMGLIPRYYYNHDTQKCEEFMYGGCRGNRNNFVGEEECMKTCKKD